MFDQSSYDDERGELSEHERAVVETWMDQKIRDGLIEVAGVDDQGRTVYQRTEKLEQMICPEW